MFKRPFFSLQLLFLLSDLVLGYSGKQAVPFFIIGRQGKISVMGAGSHPPFPAHKGSEASSTHRLSICVGTHNILKMIRHMWFWPCQRQKQLRKNSKGNHKKRAVILKTVTSHWSFFLVSGRKRFGLLRSQQIKLVNVIYLFHDKPWADLPPVICDQ